MTNTQIHAGVGRRLKAARVLAGIDQVGMANLLEVGRSTISDWENGKSEPQVSTFVRWARFTGQSLDWFAEGVETEMAPTANSESQTVRPKGFEPLTFWSVVCAIPDTVVEIPELDAIVAEIRAAHEAVAL